MQPMRFGDEIPALSTKSRYAIGFGADVTQVAKGIGLDTDW
jgi:hypothetical protein